VIWDIASKLYFNRKNSPCYWLIIDVLNVIRRTINEKNSGSATREKKYEEKEKFGSHA